MADSMRFILTLVLMAASPVPSLAQAIDLVETQRTTGVPSSPFGIIGSMVEVTPGVIVIADNVSQALYRWDVSPSRVTRLARKGRGPGEVLQPISLARRPGGGFAVYDLAHVGVLFFDRNLAFEKLVRMRGGMVSNPKSLAILGDGSFIVSGGRLRDPRAMHRYAASGDWLESFGDPPPAVVSNEAKIHSAGGAVRALRQGFLYSFGAPLRVLRFPSDQFDDPTLVVEDLEILPELTEDSLYGPVPDLPPPMDTRPFLWWHDRSTGVFELPDGRILNVVTRYYRGDSVWDLYSADGVRLSRTIEPHAYYAWDITVDGQVLASRRDPDTDEHTAVILSLDVR